MKYSRVHYKTSKSYKLLFSLASFHIITKMSMYEKIWQKHNNKKSTTIIWDYKITFVFSSKMIYAVSIQKSFMHAWKIHQNRLLEQFCCMICGCRKRIYDCRKSIFIGPCRHKSKTEKLLSFGRRRKKLLKRGVKKMYWFQSWKRSFNSIF